MHAILYCSVFHTLRVNFSLDKGSIRADNDKVALYFILIPPRPCRNAVIAKVLVDFINLINILNRQRLKWFACAFFWLYYPSLLLIMWNSKIVVSVNYTRAKFHSKLYSGNTFYSNLIFMKFQIYKLKYKRIFVHDSSQCTWISFHIVVKIVWCTKSISQIVRYAKQGPESHLSKRF